MRFYNPGSCFAYSRLAGIICAALIATAAAAAPEQFKAPHASCLQPDAKLFFVTRPYCQGKAVNLNGSYVEYRLNRHGLWAKDVPVRPAKNTVRVLILGTSLFVPHLPGENIADWLSTEWTRKFRRQGKKIEVINASVSGHSLAQIYLFLPTLLKEYNPQLVLLGTNTNSNLLNTFYHHKKAALDPATGLASAIPIGERAWIKRLAGEKYYFPLFIYSLALEEIFFLAKAKLGGEQPAEVYRRYISGIAEAARAGGARLEVLRIGIPWSSRRQLMTIPYRPEAVAESWWPWLVNEKTADAALYNALATKGLQIKDLRGSFSAVYYSRLAEFGIPEDVHPNAAGIKLLREAVFNATSPSLSR